MSASAVTLALVCHWGIFFSFLSVYTVTVAYKQNTAKRSKGFLETDGLEKTLNLRFPLLPSANLTNLSHLHTLSG